MASFTLPQLNLNARHLPVTSVSRPQLSFTHNLRGTACALVIKKDGAVTVPQRATVVAQAYNNRNDGDNSRDDRFQERVVQVRRVTKVVKGGKQLSFRAVVVIGDEAGTVGVGCASAKEVVSAVQKAVVDAKRNLISVPLSKNKSFPHRFEGVFGSARVMLRPASEGTGVIAGGAVRVVLELAGVKNAFGKQLGSPNPLNNARATVEGLRNMRTFEQVAQIRGIPLEQLLPSKAQ